MTDHAAPGTPGSAADRVRAALLADRAETAERAALLARDLDHVVAASLLVATDDEHDPEGSTIAFDRAQLIAVIDHARRHLADLDAAIARLDDGAYGRCAVCGQPITAGRLEALPATTTCIDCASMPSAR